MNKTMIKKAAAILLILCGLLAAMLVLTHPAQNGRKTTEILPEINKEPVYVECEAGVPVEASLCAKEEFTAGGGLGGFFCKSPGGGGGGGGWVVTG